ncbi:histidinol-phosphate transaminase [Streptomyces angustmyceticus]|uniref:Putative phenylalanine aminotransferase n=1 Tax=Streptomyces angustmyceticus TaxID=285578 RepID=A0A5J4LPV5_9ACTN|nr:histidinol-phosphate transaminase [Streptomyces angustmyceticus]UAL65955.1 histidinol-phosphate transaminase [Streptomyces angustmyceticus]GES33586.1 putative phenylalanine aminotransferase [Streptomyces angustmyceticus]
MNVRFAERSTLRAVRAYRDKESSNGEDGTHITFDLSSNELALPPLPTVLGGIEERLPQLARYPDPTARDLTSEVARHLCVSADELAVGPGSAGVLQQLLLALCGKGDEVVYAWPGFDAYPLLVAISGATSVQAPLTASGGHDLDEIRTRVSARTKVVILCSPHNPTGATIDHDELRGFLHSLPDHVVTVLDEAYVEFDRGSDPPGTPGLLREHRNIVVLRTFSKAYGLAGLRVGYAAGPQQVMAAVRKAAIPFGVTRFAEQAAILSLRSEGELMERLAAAAAAREELTAGLRTLGLPVLPSRANFVWLPLAGAAESFTRAAASAGVKVRSYPGHGARISVGETEAHRMLLAALGQKDHGAEF